MDETERVWDFNSYKREIFDFKPSNISYSERVGEPDELSSVIGLVSMGFQDLDDIVTAFIIEMLDIDIQKGKILVCELSFTSKVNIFSSLVHLLKGSRKFNVGDFDIDEYLKEIIKALLRCQDFRNQVIHSSFLQNFKTNGKIIRHKLSAKAKKGLVELEDEIDVPFLFDIYDYTVSLSMEIQQFFLFFNPARTGGEDIYYGTEVSDVFRYRVD